jgi:hypothetical protein
MLSVRSAPGIVDQYIKQNNLVNINTQGRESPFLSKCEKKPEIIFKVKSHSPLRQRDYVNPFFLDFLSENTDLHYFQEYYHASQSGEAFSIALAKYVNFEEKRKNLKTIDPNILKIADDWLFREVSRFCLGTKPLTTSEVLKNVSLKTSPGPLAREYADSKLASLLHPVGIELYNCYVDQMKNVGCRTFWGANLKQELRPIEKVELNKTRIFMSAPTEHFLLLQSVSLEFNEAIISAARHCLSMICIGMPLFYGNVDKLCKELSKYYAVFCTDIGGWDTSVSTKEHASAANVRWRCMDPKYKTPEYFNIFVNLYKDINLTPLVLPDGTVIWVPGQPSGQGNTGMDNSMIHVRRVFISWLLNGGLPDFDVFKANVFLKVAGDDSILAVTKFGHQFLNASTIEKTNTEFFGCDTQFSNQLEFLGHYFLFDGKTYFPGFSLSRVVATLSLKGGMSAEEAMTTACSSRLEAYTNPECCRLVDRFIAYLLRKYPCTKDIYRNEYPDDEKCLELICPGRSSNLQSRTISAPRIIASHNSSTLFMSNEKKVNTLANTQLEKSSSRGGNKGGGRNNNNNNNYNNGGNTNSSSSSSRRRRNRTRAGRGNNNQSGQAYDHGFKVGGNNRSGSSSNGNFRNTKVSSPNMLVPTMFASKKASELLVKHYPPEVIDCIRGMMIPSETGAKGFPGNAHAPVARIRTIREFQVSANFSDPNPKMNGRVSLAIHPGLGQTSEEPLNWQVSLVDTTSGFPTDLSSPDSFVQSTPGAMGSDFRLDPQASFLTQPINGQNTGTWEGEYEAPYFDPTNVFTGAFTPKVMNSGLYPVLKNFSAVGPAHGYSRWSLPVGQYNLSLIVEGPIGEVGTDMIVSGGGTAEVIQVNSLIGGDPSGTFPITFQDFQVSIYKNTDYIQIDDPYTLQLTSIIAKFSPGYFPNSPPPIPMNGGLLQKYRPTACTVTYSNTIAEMYVGGSIAGNQVDSQTLKEKYFVNGSDNTLAMWENMLEINGKPTHQGEIKNGTHVFYTPLTIDQTNFESPDNSPEIGYPQLIVSFQYTNAAGLVGMQPVGRFQIIHCYEYTTSSLGVDVYPVKGSLQLVDKVISAFDGSPVSCENPTHKAKAGKFLQGLNNVLGTVNGVVSSVGKILPIFGV